MQTVTLYYKNINAIAAKTAKKKIWKTPGGRIETQCQNII
jgi:hypothetical protein